jgi:membrane fusion protein (multidrug efflux system)
MSERAGTVLTTERREEATPKKKSRKRGLIVFVIVILVITAGVVAYVRITSAGYQSTGDATVSGNQAVVSAQALGRIASLDAVQGARVSKGEQLATLDDGALVAQEKEKQANEELAAQNAALARVKLEQAQNDFDRAAVQYQNKILSQEQYDHAKVARAEAQAGLSIARARQKVASSQLTAVKAQLAQTIINSPTDGVVAKRWSVVGDVVQPAESIYTLYDLSKLWISANFKETQIRDLAIGDPADITVDAFPGHTFGGKVESVGAATAAEFALMGRDNASGNFTKVTQRVQVRISIDNLPALEKSPATRLIPGMSAEVRVRTARE